MRLRRSKLHIPRFPLARKARSFRCSSSSLRKRFAGLRRGKTGDAVRQSALRFVSGLRRKPHCAPLLLLFPPQTLRWFAPGKDGGCGQAKCASFRFRLAPKTALRSLAPPLPSANASLVCAGERRGMRSGKRRYVSLAPSPLPRATAGAISSQGSPFCGPHRFLYTDHAKIHRIYGVPAKTPAQADFALSFSRLYHRTNQRSVCPVKRRSKETQWIWLYRSLSF